MLSCFGVVNFRFWRLEIWWALFVDICWEVFCIELHRDKLGLLFTIKIGLLFTINMNDQWKQLLYILWGRDGDKACGDGETPTFGRDGDKIVPCHSLLGVFIFCWIIFDLDCMWQFTWSPRVSVKAQTEVFTSTRDVQKPKCFNVIAVSNGLHPKF